MFLKVIFLEFTYRFDLCPHELFLAYTEEANENSDDESANRLDETMEILNSVDENRSDENVQFRNLNESSNNKLPLVKNASQPVCKYDFVNPSILYKCGQSNCPRQAFQTEDDFVQHHYIEHQNIDIQFSTENRWMKCEEIEHPSTYTTENSRLDRDTSVEENVVELSPVHVPQRQPNQRQQGRRQRRRKQPQLIMNRKNRVLFDRNATLTGILTKMIKRIKFLETQDTMWNKEAHSNYLIIHRLKQKAIALGERITNNLNGLRIAS